LRRIFRKAKEISREAEKLRVLILQLPPESRVELGNAIEITQLENSVNNTTLGLPYLNLLDGNLAMITRKLATTARAAERAASEIDREVHPWRPERDLKQPLYRLAQIWRESTGKEPTRIWDYTREMRRGPFPEFIYSAIEPLWSDAKSVDGLIDELCSKAEATPGTNLPMT